MSRWIVLAAVALLALVGATAGFIGTIVLGSP